MGSKRIIFVAQTVRLNTMFLVSNERSSSREFSRELSVYIMYIIVPSFFQYDNKMYVIYIYICISYTMALRCIWMYMDYLCTRPSGATRPQDSCVDNPYTPKRHSISYIYSVLGVCILARTSIVLYLRKVRMAQLG